MNIFYLDRGTKLCAQHNTDKINNIYRGTPAWL